MRCRARGFVLVLLSICLPLAATDEVKYPLWDGKEPIAEYARRLNLPPALSLDFGGAKIDAVLVPAGRFRMGKVAEPGRPDGSLLLSWFVAGASTLIFLAFLCDIFSTAMRARRRAQFSLRTSLALMLSASVCTGATMHLCKLTEKWKRFNQAVQWQERQRNHVRPCLAAITEPRDVTLTEPYYVSIFEVTQAQYEALMEHNPSEIRADEIPVQHVQWSDANEFCKRLSAVAAKPVRLPTEAEWEFACRGGIDAAFNCGDDALAVERAAWLASNSERIPHPVGQKVPNAFGLFDMHGNVSEWCQGVFRTDREAPAEDPVAAAASEPQSAYRITRGGSFRQNAWQARSTFRSPMPPAARDKCAGFRVVIPL